MEPETRRRLETEASWMEQFAESGNGARLSTAIARERAADIRSALADSDALATIRSKCREYADCYDRAGMTGVASAIRKIANGGADGED